MKKYLLILLLLLSTPIWSAELNLFNNYGKRTLAVNDKIFVERLLEEINFDEVALDLMVTSGAGSGVINNYLTHCKNNEFGGQLKFTLDLTASKFDSNLRTILIKSNGPANSRDFAMIFLSITNESERKELLELSAKRSKFVNKLIVGYYLNPFINENRAAFENIGNIFYAEYCGEKNN